MKHPAVAEAGVIGVTDPIVGERPRAYVVPLTKAVTEEELVKHVEGILEPHFWLTGGLKFIEMLPKTKSGKPLRRKLRELA